MKLLLLLLRCYPRDFRERFELEMVETLASASAGTASVAFVIRESVSILRGLAFEWLSDRVVWIIHRLSGVTAAIAIQSFLYGAVMPIGQNAAAGIGTSFFIFGACGLLLTALLEGSCMAVSEGR